MERVETRCKRKENWLKYYEQLYYLKDKQGNPVYKTNQSLFIKRVISSGVEGVVYKTHFTNKTRYKYKRIHQLGHFVTKALYLKRIRDNKRISDVIFNATPDQVYKLFYSRDSFDKPSLTEIITLTLTNQLVCQKISPHYCLNYYWDYEKNIIRSYNEYASSGDFSKWAQHQHSLDIWINALFQIFVGILAIQRYFNIVHTDLHIKNILVHKVQPGGFWTYIIDKKRYYLPNLGYVFVLSDFGFSWIPNHISIPWRYNQTLKYVKSNKTHFYDVAIFIKSLLQLPNIPDEIRLVLNKTFKKTDFIIFKKQYYQNMFKQHNKKDKQKSIYKYIINNYKKISRKHTSSLSFKIQEMFDIYKKRPKGSRIETYSLDKRFKRSTLPKVFKELIVT
jgi:hypothetical protein